METLPAKLWKIHGDLEFLSTRVYHTRDEAAAVEGCADAVLTAMNHAEVQASRTLILEEIDKALALMDPILATFTYDNNCGPRAKRVKAAIEEVRKALDEEK